MISIQFCLLKFAARMMKFSKKKICVKNNFRKAASNINSIDRKLDRILNFYSVYLFQHQANVL